MRVSRAQQPPKIGTSNAEMTGICWIFNFYYLGFPNPHRRLAGARPAAESAVRVVP